MKTLIRITAALLTFMMISCENLNDDPGLFPSGEGFFILNEGNFMAGNGSVSFYSTVTHKIYNSLFAGANQRALGDIPSFIATDGNTGYIVVNNSGTIEVVDIHTLESLGTLTGLSSPRQMVIYGRTGYVSSLTSDELTVIDLESRQIAGTFSIGCTSEAMVICEGKLFIANWSGGNKVVVADPGTEEVITSINVGLEPESMVIDKNKRLWVLCTGGWMGEEVPRLVKINALTCETEAEIYFSSVDDNPSSLTSNATGDTLYYLDGGVRRMPVTSLSLPEGTFIPAGDRLFYRLSASGPGGKICVTDAIDYQQKGDLLIYNNLGELEDAEETGIIPGFMLFMPD
jgi:YVTN family beta-propeller protein